MRAKRKERIERGRDNAWEQKGKRELREGEITHESKKERENWERDNTWEQMMRELPSWQAWHESRSRQPMASQRGRGRCGETAGCSSNSLSPKKEERDYVYGNERWGG